MSTKLFDDGRLRDALTYAEYRRDFQRKADADSAEELPEEQQKYFKYYRLNFGRSKRLERDYEPSERLREAVRSIDEDQTWLVLTEPWCGDSAQILPVLAAAADLNENITLRILLRDDNLDIMDQYLTDGKRGIPKLVVFDADGNELFTWGPRPEPAQGMFERGEEEGRERSEIYEELQMWYNEDKGETVDAELAEAIVRAQVGAGQERTTQDEYERRVEAQIEEWEQQIQDLRKQIENLQDNLRKGVERESSRYQKEIDSLKVKRDAARRLLEELTEAGEKAWSDLQNDLGDALEGAGQGLQRLADRLRRRRD